MWLHISACKRSGKTVKDYCTENQLSPAVYYYWLRRLAERNDTGGFTAISLAARATIEVRYPNGVQLIFSGDLNAATLQALVCCI